MGTYFNPDGEAFRKMIQSEIYVDKTGLLNYTNSVLNTMQGYLCISRPRRFGKSMAANMLAAYYSRESRAEELFSGFKISESPDFQKYANQYNTIFLNMQDFLSQSGNVTEMIALLQKSVLWELLGEYPDFRYFDETNLMRTMQDVYNKTKRQFVVVIDEWDCIFREYKTDREAQEKYLDFLRDLLKDKGYLALVYMTGILPIKKYGTHSALNMFDEFSMIEPGPLASYVGFTETEVQKLCGQYDMELEEVKNWYDGYSFDKALSVYSPRSVVSCMRLGKIGNYWNQTETFEALQVYIDMNFDGLKDDVLSMIAGNQVPVNIGSFTNDMTTFRSEDDVLTLLIHLGYLAFNQKNQMAYIPNEELRNELMDAVEENKWDEIIQFERQSIDLFNATINKDVNTVAAKIEQIHMEYTSVIQYNDENSLSSVLAIAYLGTMNYYFKPVRELPTGRGFADFVYIPKPEYINDYPALVVELKWNKNADTAMQQIRERQYPNSLLQYTGNVLLVAINYDEKTKEHVCKIEEYAKIQN